MGAKQAAEALANSKSSKYINLEDDGDFAIFSIPWYGDDESMDPYVHEQIWNEKTERFDPFTNEHKAANKKPNCRFFFSVYGKDSDEIQVFQCTPGTYKEILHIKEKHGDMSKIFIEVRRHGPKGSKKTKYKAMYDSAVSEELRARIQKMDRFDLKKEAEGDSAKGTSSSSSNGNGAAAKNEISDSIAKELLDRLRPLPEEKRNSFLAEFKIARVRALPPEKVAEALKYIDKLEGKIVENDAFA